MILHGCLMAWRRRGFWRGALIQGPSGSGKSDLMLRGLDRGGALVADDRVLVWASGGRLYGRAPDTLRGLIEARGIDVLPCPTVAFCEITLSVHCAPANREIERVHHGESEMIAGVEMPLLHLRALEASAPAKLFISMRRLGREAAKAYL
jgi:serine kinase of HPr protein (carbohydrate metabolism regulator)